ncbi:MAG: hypothetical protein ACQEXJ_12440 [Myxococcota bacterium]
MLQPGAAPETPPPSGGAGVWQSFKARAGLGGQMHGAKAGSKASGEKNRELMDGDREVRAQHLHEILSTGAGNLHNFNRVALWLMGGDPAALQRAYRAVSGGESLAATIERVFRGSPHRLRYLSSVLEDGKPDLTSRLLMAAGYISGSASADTKEFVRIVEMAPPADLARAFDREPQLVELTAEALIPFLSTSAFERVQAALEAARIQVRLDKADEAKRSGKKISGAAVEQARGDLAKARGRQLVAMFGQHFSTAKGTGLDRKAFIAELRRWVARQPAEVRNQVCEPGNPFHDHLQKKTGWKNLHLRLSPADMEYILAQIRHREPVPAEFFQHDRAVPGDAKEAAQQKQEAEQAAATVADLEAHLARKENKRSWYKRMKWDTVCGKIEALSDRERQWFLRGFLFEGREREVWDHPEQYDPAHVKTHHEMALHRLEQRLQRAGMKSDTRARALAAFAYGAGPNVTRKNGTYQRLRSLAFGWKDPRLSSKALSLVEKLGSSEYLMVRRDAELMDKLRARTDKRRWSRIEAILGLGHDKERESDEEVIAGHALREQEARERAADLAELDPKHWSALLASELGKSMKGWDRGRVLSLATKAYYAGRRRSKLPPVGARGRRANTPQSMGPMTPQAFTNAVYDGLSGSAKKTLGTSRLAGARKALLEGRAVTARERIRGATFRMLSPKRVKQDARESTILKAIEDASGLELLEQWSNYADWRALREEQRALRESAKSGGMPKGDRARLSELDARVQQFHLDVHPEVQALVTKRLPRAQSVPALTKLRNRLADAMEQDKEFRAALEESGLAKDEFAAERTRVAASLDEQRLEDTGLQHDKLSAKSALRKEARNEMLGTLRGANDVIREPSQDPEAARQQVNAVHVPKIVTAREDLARRTAAFQALRSDVTKYTQIAVGVVLAAVVAAIGAGVTAATFGGSAPIWASILMAMGLAMGSGVVKGMVDKALLGDRFNARARIGEVAVDTLMAGIGAGVGGAHLAATSAMGIANSGDLLEIFASSSLKFAMNKAAGESVTTAVNRATRVEPAQAGLGEEAVQKLYAWIRDFATEVGGGMAKQAALQDAGLWRKKDDDGKRVLDRYGNDVGKLDAGEKIEKAGVEQGIGAPLSGVAAGLDAGKDEAFAFYGDETRKHYAGGLDKGDARHGNIHGVDPEMLRAGRAGLRAPGDGGLTRGGLLSARAGLRSGETRVSREPVVVVEQARRSAAGLDAERLAEARAGLRPTETRRSEGQVGAMSDAVTALRAALDGASGASAEALDRVERLGERHPRQAALTREAAHDLASLCDIVRATLLGRGSDKLKADDLGRLAEHVRRHTEDTRARSAQLSG